MSSLTIVAAAIAALTVLVTDARAAPATTQARPATQATRPATKPAPFDVSENLRKGHPRLLVLEDDIGRVSGEIQKNATAAEYFREIRAAADKILTEPPVERKLIGPRMLAVSRQALARVMTLGAVYRLTGEPRYGERARVEMLACAAFTDWNPSHFLDTAEMTAALGIGYDWFYGGLTDEQRATIRTAIVEKGLTPGLNGYRRGVWWARTNNNWAQVCAGGLTIGALAIADEEPQLAHDIVNAASEAMAAPMAMFAPDGACVEGPAYWGYATQYTAYYLAALQTALNAGFHFLRQPGFAETGRFRIHTLGPTELPFNFADAHANKRPSSQMFWFARAFDRPVYAVHERSLDQPHDALHLLWFDGRGDKLDIAALPPDARFRRVEVACFRGAWNDRNATYLAFKGGDNRVNHAHLDLGTFVLDAGGVRWAEELGPADYNLPGYFGAQRWDYYRLGTAGQNALLINDQNQAIDGKAPIVAFKSGGNRAFAVADLSHGYRYETKRVRRGAALLERTHALIQDEVTADEPAEVVWQMHTRAKVEIHPHGKSATLTRDGSKLSARLLEPADAKFDYLHAPPGAPQLDETEAAKRASMGKLIVRLEGATDARIAVLLGPTSDYDVKLEPLEAWIAAGEK